VRAVRRRKASVTAPANIAFVKYWGARDLERAFPLNPSISMTLTRCLTHTTVEHGAGDGDDEVWIAGDGGSLAPPPRRFAERVLRQLGRIRRLAGAGGAFRIATRNSFPADAGLASSASGFAALTLAATLALGLELSREELSDLARQSGSGSAARSLLGGYVEWPRGAGEAAGYAFALAPPGHWDLRDVIALVADAPKASSSLEGHRRARSSAFFASRLELLPGRLAAVRRAIADRDLRTLGPAVEAEAIDLHLIAMSSKPPIFYWAPATLAVLAEVRQMRRDGVRAWATLDAGPNVHVLCEPRDEEAVAARLAAVPGVARVLRDGVGEGPCREAPHLF
jgi:diphosphomevalonate decarboxylase